MRCDDDIGAFEPNESQLPEDVATVAGEPGSIGSFAGSECPKSTYQIDRHQIGFISS